MLPRSHTPVVRKVRYTKPLSHFQVFGMSDRMYYGARSWDDAFRPRKKLLKWQSRAGVVTRVA